jgi:hypothetical protein
VRGVTLNRIGAVDDRRPAMWRTPALIAVAMRVHADRATKLLSCWSVDSQAADPIRRWRGEVDAAIGWVSECASHQRESEGFDGERTARAQARLGAADLLFVAEVLSTLEPSEARACLLASRLVLDKSDMDIILLATFTRRWWIIRTPRALKEGLDSLVAELLSDLKTNTDNANSVVQSALCEWFASRAGATGRGREATLMASKLAGHEDAASSCGPCARRRRVPAPGERLLLQFKDYGTYRLRPPD